MFSRISALSILALPYLAAASAVARGNGPSQCNTGEMQCCNSVQASNSNAVTQLVSLLGINVGPISGLVGMNCSPITAIGAGGNSCTAQPVCCTGNQFNGLINVGCTPINLGL